MVRLCSIVLLLFITICSADAEVCNAVVIGRVYESAQPLPGVVVHLADSLATVTDGNGYFAFTALCPGVFRLRLRSPGFLQADTIVVANSIPDTMFISLLADDHQLREVVISREKIHELHTVASTTLNGAALMKMRGLSLGETLKDLPGLNAVQNGPSMVKPVIHGLHSNRVLIMNNGVRQQGQQWGGDHAPEIDPFAASQITVLKGAASVRYGADAVSGAILVEPAQLPSTKGMHADIYLSGATNGRMGAASGSVEGAFGGKLSGLAWRAQGTLRQAGNFKTPEYHLINTGLKETDYALTLGYKRKRWTTSIYYSMFTTKLGIFLGAESGNDSELVRKFKQGRPELPSFFTYAIGRPYQAVEHQLVKGATTYKFANGATLDAIVARQHDLRNEYDAEPLIVSNNPAALTRPQLSFELTTHSWELVFTQPSKKGWSGSLGTNGTSSGNVFRGERYLIPNYRDYNAGLYAIQCYHRGRWNYEAGLRYDYRWLRVYQRNATTLGLYNTTYAYLNFTGTLGASYYASEHLRLTANTGVAWRAPSINEMYLNGQHFSAARFEIGDSALKTEKAINNCFELHYTAQRFTVEGMLYYNLLNNFIYTMPLEQARVLPSGTFPTFKYVQNNVTLRGCDILARYDITDVVGITSKVSVVRGYNVDAHQWLIYMPSDRFQNGITLRPAFKWNRLQQPYLTLESVYVAQQSRVPPATDYIPPPGSYHLFNAALGAATRLHHHDVYLNFSINNIFNTRYREYLDNFRYFADQIGTNITVRLKYSL